MEAGLVKRLRREESLLSERDAGGYFLQRVGGGLVFEGFVEGPEGPLYSGLRYLVRFVLEPSYPATPPRVFFATGIFHPNIDSKGTVCMDLLKEKWCMAFTLRSLLEVLRQLLREPNPDSPLNVDAAILFRQGKLNLMRELVLLNYDSQTAI